MPSVLERFAVAPERLRRRLDPAQLPFESTEDVPPLTGTIGQPRALDAIAFALEAPGQGHNLFVAGAPGSGRETTVMAAVEAFAATRPRPPDWIYVHNFREPDQPNAIALPAGRGRAFADDMAGLLRELQREIPRAFESEEVERRRQALLSEITARRDAILAELRAFARAREFAVEQTPVGFVSVALRNGEPLPAEVFAQLPPEQRQEIDRRGQEVQAQVGATVRRLRQLEKEATGRIQQLERDVVLFVVRPRIEEVRERYADQAEILEFLGQVESDVSERFADFLPGAEPAGQLLEGQLQIRQEPLARYQVNVFIHSGHAPSAPVVIERNPTYANLIGRIDYRAILGAMVTDFRQIKPGALHRANGGFLVLHALDVLRNPFAWDALKRALICREVQIENVGEQYSVLPTARLRPEPIPLDLKVILIGSPLLYMALYHLDEDFRELFDVRADFAPDMPWNDENLGHYAAFISRRVRETGLRHFGRAAVARVAEHGARLRDHQNKLSVRLLDIANLIDEASYWAGKAGHDLVLPEDVDRAIDQRDYRANLYEERFNELIAEGTISIDTTGERIGQVNGLSIADLGDYAFGRPSRITARVSLGRGNIQSIEREIELSGPIHSKGFLILSGYLQAQYAQEWPLALGATITFEQSYDEIEGDSASSTELYALLSTLADVPLKQGIAVTGSVNQYGEVQAVGGVTRKIEGFFAVCRERGLTGEQGVIIPASNVQHLMLRDEVVAAVAAGRFHVWAVRHVDEGIELLTGRPAGERGPDGRFPEGSVHALVEQRLRRYAEQARAFAFQPGERAGADGRPPVRQPAAESDDEVEARSG